MAALPYHSIDKEDFISIILVYPSLLQSFMCRVYMMLKYATPDFPKLNNADNLKFPLYFVDIMMSIINWRDNSVGVIS